jgi:hypothetical protein
MRIEHNIENLEFHTIDNTEKAFLNYRKKSTDTLEYYEIFVPASQRDKRIASQLTTEALSYAQNKNLKVIPTCSFVRSFIIKNNKFRDVILAE